MAGQGYKSIIKKLCNCRDYTDAIQCQKITINRSDLKLFTKEYNEAQALKKSWQLPITILASLLIALATTSFEPSIEVPLAGVTVPLPPGMDTLLWTATIIVFLWFLISGFRSFKNPDPLKILLAKVDSAILNKPDRTSVFIIKRNDEEEIELLVERKASWACYFLPYVKQRVPSKSSDLQFSDLKRSLGDKIDVGAENLEIDLLHEFNFKSEKFDPPQKVVKEYHFEVFHVKIKALIPHEPFTVGNRHYSWKRLNELEQDENTMRNNRDIISHVRENYNDLIVKVSSYERT